MRLNEPLAKHTTYRIGGPAKYLVEPTSVDELAGIAEQIKKSGEPYAVLGNGSNLLAPDEGFPGWVIKTNLLPQFIQPLAGAQLRVSAGHNNSRVIRAAADLGLSGLEYLAGVPGTIGGAVWMNAGVPNGFVAKNIISVESFSLTRGKQSYSGPALKYSYREQHFMKEDEIVIAATFQMQKADPDAIKTALGDSLRMRKQAQPIEMPSCGSVFRNPEGTSAWKCVDQVGLRGHAIGGARISPKHSNFIVNEGGATMQDVLSLIALAKERVKAQLGIDLVEEVVVLKPRFL